MPRVLCDDSLQFGACSSLLVGTVTSRDASMRSWSGQQFDGMSTTYYDASRRSIVVDDLRGRSH